MKINLIPTKKLALLSAAVCAVMLAFSHNASAVTDLTSGDGHELGRTAYQAGGPILDADKTALVNHLIDQTRSTTEPVQLGGNSYIVFRSNNNFGTLPGPAVFGLNGTGTTIPAATIGSGLYSYLFATYTNDSFGTRGYVWYIGNLSGDITIPDMVEGIFNLTGWTLFGPGGVPGVPDGGTTVMLLGAALGALGMARRFLKA